MDYKKEIINLLNESDRRTLKLVYIYLKALLRIE